MILGIFLMASPGLSMEVLPFVLAFWLMFRGFSATGYSMDPVNTGMTGSIGNSESYSYQITNTLNYNQTFAKKHKVNLLLGHEVSYSEDESNSISVKQIAYPNHGLMIFHWEM